MTDEKDLKSLSKEEELEVKEWLDAYNAKFAEVCKLVSGMSYSDASQLLGDVNSWCKENNVIHQVVEK